MSLKNADDLLIANTLPQTPPSPPKEKEVVPPKEVVSEVEENHAPSLDESVQEVSEKPAEIVSQGTSDEDTDDYGNAIPKAEPRMYSEDDVQRMIRERLSRGQHGKETSQEVQQEANREKFEYNEESSEPWQQQLETFVENTLHKVTQREHEKKWQQQEAQKQVEFEQKFSSGMSKYKDFTTVVSNKPITNAMMMATRAMKDPAAFIYAAAKQHPKEIERIAQIPDALSQATEMGRLEERMRKTRNASKSSKPLSPVRGDVGEKGDHKRSLDDLIRKDAERKYRR